ncbi:MAG: MerR family DNA-binding transcriptional regulator [Raoultibacter sp.]
MKNELLSIGEVSKMKGVSVKSLRYYERLGILTPAFINPQSGYRYYSMNQMIDIDTIITCIELGIPLKDLVAYTDRNGSLDTAMLLNRGRSIAIENLREAQSALFQIDDYLEEIAAQKEFRGKTASYERSFPDRSALLLPWKETTFNAKRYVTAITQLYQEAKRLGFVPLYLQGMVFLPGTATREASAYLEVHIPPLMPSHPPTQNTIRIDTLPGGTFIGQHLTRDGFENCFKTAFAEAETRNPARGIVVATEVWQTELKADHYTVEILVTKQTENPGVP